MVKKSTQTDLLIYAYNEAGLLDSDRIQRAIDGDPVVADEFREITEVIETLDKGKLKPSAESVAAVLERLND